MLNIWFFSGNFISVYISISFTAIFRYSIIPDKLMDVFIVPIIKNKCKNLSCKDNYRPISLSCIISKLLESIILKLIIKYLNMTDNQFAFKSNHSTTMCIYIIKHLIFESTSNNTPSFLDIKKHLIVQITTYCWIF